MPVVGGAPQESRQGLEVLISHGAAVRSDYCHQQAAALAQLCSVDCCLWSLLLASCTALILVCGGADRGQQAL
jgi:hypothetical protein